MRLTGAAASRGSIMRSIILYRRPYGNRLKDLIDLTRVAEKSK